MVPVPRPSPSVGIAIVNWNAGAQVEQCLASIREADWSAVTLSAVVVVDNASTDGSLEHISKSSWLPLTIVRNAQNCGFAVACNQAAALIDAEYILFLNPDTRLPPDAVRRAVQWMDDPAHRQTGIAGIQLVDDDGVVARSCARFPTATTCVLRSLGLDRLPGLRGYMMNEWDHADSRQVDHVIGAFYLVRAAVFRALAGFDESFFVYLEDVDFSYRARRAGWLSHYLADARAYHKGGGTSEQVKSTRLFYSLRSRLRYARKHFSPLGGTAVAVSTLLLEPVVRLAACTLGSSPTPARETLSAYAMLWRSIVRR
jgi:GT2 family glycosyltransferase